MDRLEDELGDRLDIIRVNIQEPVGRELAGSLGFQYTPTFIFFDENGIEVWREVGGLNEQKLRDSLP